MADTNLTQLIINQLTRAQYDALQPQANQLYLVVDEPYMDTSYIVTSVGVSSTDLKVPSAKAVYNFVHNNSEGFLKSITGTQVTTALGYTPYNSSNPAGYITGINSSMVTTALGYTPYNSSNPSGYQTATNVNSAISTHNTNQTAHQDIRNAIIKNLSGLSDVAVSGVTSGQFLAWNGSKWVPSTSSASINWGDIGGTLANQTDLNTALAGKQPLLPAGTTGYYLQKTASGVQWSEVQSAPPVDNVSVSLNQSDQLQAFGTINQNGTGTALKHWSGTLDEYNDIASKSPNTLYHITDDSEADAYEAYTKAETDALLSNKADKNEVWTPSTSTQQQKQTIVGWGIPDYSAMISITATGFVAPKQGIILFYQTGETNSALEFKINNVRVAYKTNASYSGHGFCSTLPIDAGDVLSVSNFTSLSVNFCPFKGV